MIADIRRMLTFRFRIGLNIKTGKLKQKQKKKKKYFNNKHHIKNTILNKIDYVNFSEFKKKKII